MFKNINFYASLLLIVYFFTGIFLSINSGISHDEFHEQLNWEVNLKSIKDFFLTGNYPDLLEYKDRYHGIGFNIISQPFQIIIKDLILDYSNLNEYGSILISKHPVVFIIFFISGFFYILFVEFYLKKKIFL